MRIDRIKLISEMAKQEITSIRLAEMAGVSRVTVSAVRRGKSCSKVSAEKIAAGLGLNVDDLLEDRRKPEDDI